MAALILTCYSAYETQTIKDLIEELGITELCLWHPAAYDNNEKMFQPKRKYLKAVYADLQNRVKKDIKLKTQTNPQHIKTSRVYIFQQLVFEVDYQVSHMFKDQLQVLKPLQYIYSSDLIRSVARELKKGKGVRLQGFFKRVQFQIPRIYKDQRLLKLLSKSTDQDNRSSMSQKEANACYQLHDYSFATTPQKALTHLKDFISRRFGLFAQFQDAVVPNQNQLYHSKLSAPLNCGLIKCQDVVNAIIHHAQSQKSEKQLKSLEAFLRQLVGWREYALTYYIVNIPTPTQQIQSPIEVCIHNARGCFKHNTRRLKRSVWFSKYKKTPFESINQLLAPIWKEGYAHHIIRLYLLSFMIQLFVDPKDIYDWMMAAFVDSLDFVMLFNVFAMGYFDRRFTHKQYLFSSQYMYIQSNGRLPRDERLDNLYRLFTKKYKDELRYLPTTRDVDEQQAHAVIDYFTE